MFKIYHDQIIKRCVTEDKIEEILRCCHSMECRGHFSGNRTATKILQSGFYWPTIFKDAYKFAKVCDDCQRVRNILKRNEIPQNVILEVEIFDVWGIDFMGPFLTSFAMKYILVAVNYVSNGYKHRFHLLMMLSK